MDVMPVNLVVLAGVVLGSLMLLIPIAGVTARFAIKPITQALMKVSGAKLDRDTVQMLERRMALLEQEVHSMAELRSDLTRLVEDLQFQKQLGRPDQAPHLPDSGT